MKQFYKCPWLVWKTNTITMQTVYYVLGVSQGRFKVLLTYLWKVFVSCNVIQHSSVCICKTFSSQRLCINVEYSILQIVKVRVFLMKGTKSTCSSWKKETSGFRFFSVTILSFCSHWSKTTGQQLDTNHKIFQTIKFQIESNELDKIRLI